MDFIPQPKTEQQAPEAGAPATKSGEAAERKATSSIEANKRYAQEVAERVKADAAGRQALKKWQDEHGKRGTGAQQDAERLSAADRAAGITLEMLQKEQDGGEQEEQQQEDEADDQGGLNHEDPWDVEGAGQQPKPDAEIDAFERYRTSKGFKLEAPVNGVALDEAAITDWGHAAQNIGLPPETAQEFIGIFAGVATTERDRVTTGGGSYDPDLTVSELRFEFGAELEPTLARIEKFCAERPALATYLDTTGLGNSPEVLRMLAGAATIGTSPEKARAFIDKVKKDGKHPYWQGSKLALAQMRYAYAVAGND